MLKKSLTRAIKAFYGSNAIQHWQDGEFVITNADDDSEAKENVFPDLQACYDYIVREREKQGMALYFCKEAPHHYFYNIPELDTAVLRGYNKGPDKQEQIKLKDVTYFNIHNRRKQILEALAVAGIAAVALVLIATQQLLNGGSSIPGLITQIVILVGLSSSICFVAFALWRNYRDRQRLNEADYKLHT